MKFNLEDVIAELYGKSMHQQAQITMLYALSINLAQKVYEKGIADKVPELYFNGVKELYEKALLDSPLKDEYLDKISKDFLNDIPGIDLS